MRCIVSPSTDPYFNIASEDYLLRQFTDDIFLLYRNEPSVIVGKHQNTLAEIDINYIDEQGIKVVRRLSGGGSVYHDLGNLNFTFIRNGKEGKLVDFQGFTKPIIAALANLGIEAYFQGHNSLMINEKKISGNAEHVFKNRVLHHGTLLFSTNLAHLARVLYVDEDKYSDKAVKSVRAAVTNIIEHLTEKMTIEEFTLFIKDQIQRNILGARDYSFTQVDIDQINKLNNEKYATWDWNFGYSPSYNLEREILTPLGSISLNIQIDRGVISDASVVSTTLSKEKITKIKSALIDCRHDYNEIRAALLGIGLDEESARTISRGII